MRTPKLSDERGIALALAVFALVVIGALVAGVFFSGRLEQRSGTNTVFAAQAFEAAEAGAAMVIDGWAGSSYNGLGINQTAVNNLVMLAGRSGYESSVTRLNDNLFLIKVTGQRFGPSGTTANDLLARRRIGLLARLQTYTMNVRSAITARGNVEIKGNAVISGHNTDPAGWTGCPADGTSLPAIETSGDVTGDGKGSITIEGAGDPPFKENLTDIQDSLFNNPFDELKKARDITLANASYSPVPVVVATAPSRCNTGLVTNWGEPRYVAGAIVPCQNYFPVIYRQGDLTLNNGRGQGVLLVDGNLRLAGNFEFAGIVIVKGTLDASNGTNSIFGAAYSSNALLNDISIAGTPTVKYSSCAVSRALTNAASAQPLAERSWVQLYN